MFTAKGLLQDFEADKASLLRMLADFQTEQGGRELVAAAKPDAAASPEGLPGMDFLMQRYESELKKPIRSIVSGQLARSLLIQVRPGFEAFQQWRSYCSPGIRVR